MLIGVLAIQGSVEEHLACLKKLNVETKEIRHVEDLKNIDGLIMPGGESTTISKLLKKYNLDKEIIKRVKSGMPIYGTCAGLILLSKNNPHSLKLMNIEVDRNAYGSQLDSFETEILLEDQKIKISAIFIRAPIVTKVGDDVEILARHNNMPVLIREKNVLGSSFHPELTKSLEVYKIFLSILNK